MAHRSSALKVLAADLVLWPRITIFSLTRHAACLRNKFDRKPKMKKKKKNRKPLIASCVRGWLRTIWHFPRVIREITFRRKCFSPGVCRVRISSRFMGSRPSPANLSSSSCQLSAFQYRKVCFQFANVFWYGRIVLLAARGLSVTCRKVFQTRKVSNSAVFASKDGRLCVCWLISK